MDPGRSLGKAFQSSVSSRWVCWWAPSARGLLQMWCRELQPSSLPPFLPFSLPLFHLLSLLLSLSFFFTSFCFLFCFSFCFCFSFSSLSSSPLLLPGLAPAWQRDIATLASLHPPLPSGAVDILASSPACRRWDRSGDALAASGVGTTGREQAHFGGTGGVPHTVAGGWHGQPDLACGRGVCQGWRSERSRWRQEDGGEKKTDGPPKAGFPTGSASADSQVSPSGDTGDTVLTAGTTRGRQRGPRRLPTGERQSSGKKQQEKQQACRGQGVLAER